METRPDMKRYRTLASVVVINGVAAITTALGIYLIIMGITSNTMIGGMSGAIIGAEIIILSCFLFAFANIVEDLHRQLYLTEYYGEETVNYHKMSLEKLQSMERLIQQKTGMQ